MLKKFARKQEGFTLIELLVVISIIGILSSIVLVSMGGARTKARDAKRQSDIRQIGTALELYYTDIEAYAATGGTADKPTSISTYMAVVPDDPKSGSSYIWVSNSGSDQKFCIYAILEKTCDTGKTAYFVASQDGVSEVDCRTTATVPTLATCR